MGLRKAEQAAIAVTLLVIAATIGFRLGRRSTPADVAVRTAVETVQPTETVRVRPGGADVPSAVNINTADLEELCALDGIGETLAKRIIEYREENGPFDRIEDITKVSGIGSGLLERLQDRLTIGQP